MNKPSHKKAKIPAQEENEVENLSSSGIRRNKSEKEKDGRVLAIYNRQGREKEAQKYPACFVRL